MHSHSHSFKSITPFLFFVLSFTVTVSAYELNEAERLAVVRKWIPHYHNHLQLIFEYDPEKQTDAKPSSEQMHKAIDKAGPTVTILEVQTAYETKYRVIGGYNPYRWKTWYGHYETNAGKFIFDVGREMHWKRAAKRTGSFKTSTADYGLAFGGGDLVINPDLSTGSARNTTFSNDPNSSVLTGQAGDFLIKSLRVYQVVKTPEVVNTVLPMAKLYYEAPAPAPSPIPDSSSHLFEISIALLALGYLKLISRKH